MGTPVALDPLLVAPGFGCIVRKVAAGGAVLPGGRENGLVADVAGLAEGKLAGPSAARNLPRTRTRQKDREI